MRAHYLDAADSGDLNFPFTHDNDWASWAIAHAPAIQFKCMIEKTRKKHNNLSGAKNLKWMFDEMMEL